MASKIKGAALTSGIALFEELIGPRRLQQIVATCPPETQRLMARTILGVEWIPLDVWGELMQRLYVEALGADENKLLRLIRAACQRDFSTTYRPFVANVQPAALLAKIPQLWPQFFDSGTLTVGPIERQGERSVVTLQLRNLEAPTAVFTIIIQGYLEQMLTMAGARELEVQRQREKLFNGRVSCDWRIRFF